MTTGGDYWVTGDRSIHRQPPGGTRIASAHGPCQGATRLLHYPPALQVTAAFRCGPAST